MSETSERTEPEAQQQSAPVAHADVVNTEAAASDDAAAAESSSQVASGPHAASDDAGGGASDGASHAASDEASHEAGGDEANATAEGESAGEDAGDDDSAGGDESAQAGDEGAPGDPATKAKRKRRRRRKRKDGTVSGEVTAVGAASDGGGEAPATRATDSKKKESHAPFAYLFSGSQAGKRHAFAVGEVVAGRVQRVEHGVIVVDLFGKAIAIADEYEPREVPPLPEPPEQPAFESGEAHAALAATEAGEQHAPDAALGSEADQSADTTTSVGEAYAPSEVDPLAQTAPAITPAGLAVEQSASHAAEAVSDSFDTSGVNQVSDEAAPAPLTAAEPAAEPAAAYTATSESSAGDEVAASDTTSSSGELAAAQGNQEIHESGDDLDDDHDDEPESAAAEPPQERPEPPKLGAVFKGRVGAISESGHVAILNRIVDGRAVRDKLETLRREHKRVHGVVYGYNRGGFDVLVEGVRAFCPASAMALEDIHDPHEFVGTKLEFLLPASRAGSKDLIVSRRSILERLNRRKTKEFLRSLTPGQKFKGRVTAVRDFGLFVDIGGVEGLVHQSELSFAFGTKPNSVAKVGDEIDVQVLRIGGDARRESGKKERLTRVSLSIKALLPDPWDAHADALHEGNVHKGKVVRATEFGAFIEIVPSIEGLLHITELGRDLKHGSQAVKEGEEIYVAIDRVDRRARRISLSKLSPAEVQEFEAGGLTKDDAAARNLRQGNNVKLKIERIEPRCVFARVSGTIGKRGRAFIPSSETNTDRGTDLRKRFPIGTEVEAKIIGIDRDGSLKCSVKAMLVDEERQAVKNYRREAAKQGFGTFGDLLRAKLGGGGEAQK